MVSSESAWTKENYYGTIYLTYSYYNTNEFAFEYFCKGINE